MPRCRWFSVLLLLLPTPATALSLHWASGSNALTFSEARRCTLVVEAGSTEGALPLEWTLLWVADSLGNLVIVTDSTFVTPTMAQVSRVTPPSVAEADANQLTAKFRFPGFPTITAARWILDLPAGSKGKFIAYAPVMGPDATATRTARSQVAVFNGGVDGEFPPLVMGATGDHRTTRLSVRAVGVGLGASTSARLVAADTSWHVPLTITESTDSTFAAEVELPVQLPDAILQVSPAGQVAAKTATGLPTSQVMAPLLSPVTIRGNSFLVPPDSAGVIPKDFAFVYNTVPTAIPGVWRNLFHLLYIRRLPNGDEWTLGHAWSPDLQNWTSDHNAFGTGPIGTFDAGHVWAPSIVQNGNLSYLFYTAVDTGGNQRIGRVTTSLLDTTNGTCQRH